MPFYKLPKNIVLPLICPSLKRGLGRVGGLGRENSTVQETGTWLCLHLTTVSSNKKQVVGNWVC